VADAKRFRDGRTVVALDLPKAGSMFVVLSPGVQERPERGETSEIAVNGPWNVSFAYHKIDTKLYLPRPRVMKNLVEWTTSGEKNLRDFSGRAVYSTEVDIPVDANWSNVRLSLSCLPSGLARVFVNGSDCGVVWCAPWAADVTTAVRPGRNVIRIEYVNNWHNRLVADAALPKSARVTTTPILLTDEKRDKYGDKLPYSKAVSAHDPLIPSGLVGPIRMILSKSNISEVKE
jgi:hypothetical protein